MALGDYVVDVSLMLKSSCKYHSPFQNQSSICDGLPKWLSSNESPCQCRRPKTLGFSPWVRKIHWRRKWQPTPEFLPGKSRWQRSLVDYSPWGRKSWIRWSTHESIVVVAQSLSRVWLFATLWTAARQGSLSFTISWSLLKLMSIESVMASNHLIFCCPLLFLLSILAVFY